MLLSFSIENFRSFKEETSFSMLADKRVMDHPEQVAEVKIPGGAADGVLRYGLIYGPNNCGKSNFIWALQGLSALVRTGGSVEALTRHTNLFNRGHDRPLRVELHYLNDGQIFHYGLSLTKDKVDSEWLYSVGEDREVCLFERTDNSVKWGKSVMGEDSRHHGFLDYVGIGCPNYRLLLHEASIRNVDAITPAKNWFRRVVLVSASFPDALLRETLYNRDDNRRFVADLLNRADTGISALEVNPVTRNSGSEELTTYSIKTIKNEMADDGQPVVMDMDIHESDGTRRLPMLFIPLRFANEASPVYLLDEVERSLHVELTDFIIREYLETCIARGGQMIVATHDTRLMAAEKIRRDGIWFMDLEPGHGTRLRSLADFEPRGPVPREKRYLEGRFGGIPILQNSDSAALPEAGVSGA